MIISTPTRPVCSSSPQPPVISGGRSREIAHLPDSRLVPLATLPRTLPALDRERPVVVLCHHGIRSASAAEFLRRQGFRRVWNLAGGIERWSREVDASVPRY